MKIMAKKQKQFRPKPRLPKGLRDERGALLLGEQRMIETIKSVYDAYGFDPLSTPAFEYADALGKFLPDQDRPNEGVFSFLEDEENWVSLRYDLTAPLARFVAENYDALPKPFRRYQWGPVWRNEKPGPGRFRQFTQIDADTVGAASMAADAELIAMMVECMEKLGVPSTDYIVRVNNRKVLDGVLEHAQLSPDTDNYETKRLTVLRAIDKLDRLGPEGVRALLGKGRKDESGDYTKGAELEGAQIEAIMTFTESGNADRQTVCKGFEAAIGNSEVGRQGIDELLEIDRHLSALDIGPDKVIFDPSVVRGLGYYTGPVFEVELTFETEDEDGEIARFGSVGSGGRYDDLIERFKGVKVPATGCSFGVSRLYAALEHLGKNKTDVVTGPVVVLVMDQSEVLSSTKMVRELRENNIRAEMYMGTSGMKAQLKYADKREAAIVVIEGEEERAQGMVTLKDLVLGTEMSKQIEDNKAWREDQPAQISVPRAQFVDGVKQILSRYT